ncbi:hypothetical protein [Aureivirga marina]|uniref:hypothetical protein n=1 Tax=Aureivirga marina TaxID=1182451 RepID=UPI0018CA4658|nr:hypothetical protein [Aureivirga marina]
MSNLGKVLISMQVIAGPKEVEEGKRLFASHAKFMEETHYKEGKFKMISYDIAHGPEFLDPLAIELTPTGNTVFLMVEIYESEEGVAEHWRLGQTVWKDFEPMMVWLKKCNMTILHGSKVVQSLW